MSWASLTFPSAANALEDLELSLWHQPLLRSQQVSISSSKHGSQSAIVYSSQPTMDEDDFDDWKTCWQVNLLFHKRISSKTLKCIVCSATSPVVNGSMRSMFWVEATRCSAGHRQVTPPETQLPYTLGVCAVCDQNYMLDVVKGKNGCRREGCRRAVRVHEAKVHAKLWSNLILLQKVFGAGSKAY